jgi:acetyl-CoA C-acetyltransferase
MSKEVYIIDAARTAIGNFLGSLKEMPAAQLSAELIKVIVARNKIPPDQVSQVILGQVLLGGEGQNPARQAAVFGGLPYSVPAFVINQVCGSGLRSVVAAAQSISLEDASLILAGGQENMSMSRNALHTRRHKMGNLECDDMMLRDGLTDAFNDYHMGITAENLVKKYSLTRAEQDKFAYESQQKAAAAQKSGFFKDEIVPIVLKKEVFESDEFIKPDLDIPKLAAMHPAFLKNGTVTAGNSSGLNDGAAVLLLTSNEGATKYSLTPMARVVSHAIAGVDPSIMGIGPVEAVRSALSKAGWTLNSVDLIESNEAFAAQCLAVNKELGWNPTKINISGGAIALGHPIGASGARILTTLLYNMRRHKVSRGLAALCIGGGMGIAMCVERV